MIPISNIYSENGLMEGRNRDGWMVLGQYLSRTKVTGRTIVILRVDIRHPDICHPIFKNNLNAYLN